MSNKKWRRPAGGVDTSSEPVTGPLSDAAALGMLARAAECIDGFIGQVRAALTGAKPEELAELRAEVADTNGKPRRSRLVGLFRLGISACSLLPRLLAITNPGLVPSGRRAPRQSAIERMMASIQRQAPAPS